MERKYKTGDVVLVKMQIRRSWVDNKIPFAYEIGSVNSETWDKSIVVKKKDIVRKINT